MNPDIHAATHAAAQQKLLIITLQKAGANSRDKAIAQSALPAEMNAQIKYYLARDLIRSTAEGGLYINTQAYDAHLARMKTVGKWLFAIIGSAAMLGMLFLISRNIQLL